MYKAIKRIITNSSVLYTLLSGIGSGINFVTLIVFGRLFSVETYGQITTFQALVANIGVFMIPLQIIICKRIASGKDEKKVLEIAGMNFIINSITLIIMLCCYSLLMKYLHFDNVYKFALFVFLVLTNNIYIFFIGVAQGKILFILLGWVNLLFYSIKIIISVILNYFNLNIISIIIGFLISLIVSICIMCYEMNVSWKEILKTNFEITKETIEEYFWTLLLYMAVSLYMNNADLLIGNFYCSQKELGLYSVPINLAKISVFLIATPVATIVLPRVAASSNNVVKQRSILVMAEVITFFASVLYGVVLFFSGKWLINFFYGEIYVEGSKYLLACIVFSVILGMFWVFYQYCVASDLMKAFTVITVLVGFGVSCELLIVRPSIGFIPIGMSISMLLSVCITLLYLKNSRMR